MSEEVRVFVVNMHGQPLMPCKPAKARKLLKTGSAKVLKRTPFTIQLTYETTNYMQEIILGVDAGSKTIGISASTRDTELLAAEVKLRNDVVKKLSTRREFRRTRRNRKKRHRAARFKNRTRSKHKGWFAPSVEVKIQEHITVIKRVCTILPVSKVIIETAEFDLQKMKATEDGAPVLSGVDYQRGEMFGHYNTRQYVLWRDNYTCQCCGAHGDDIKFHVHHRESRRTGGNAPDNLVTLCSECHEKLHAGVITMDKLKKRGRRSYRDATFMGIMRKTLVARLCDVVHVPVVETRGYVTKATRVEVLGLPKSHVNDALAIAHGPQGFDSARGTVISRAGRVFCVCAVRHHNRQLHKARVLRGGYRKNNQAARYVHGFRLFDKVLFDGVIECFVWGRRSSGGFLLRLLDGSLVRDGVSYKRLVLLERSSNYLVA